MFRYFKSIYYDGLRTMPRWGKVLCMIIIAKLLIMFIVFKLLLMPNYLNSLYKTDEEKSNHVFNNLITKP